MQKTIELNDQKILVKRYFKEYCTKAPEIKAFSISHFWAESVSEWSGCTISTEAVIEVFEAEGVISEQLIEGVKLFALYKKM